MKMTIAKPDPRSLGVGPVPHPCPTQDIIFHPFHPNCVGHGYPSPCRTLLYTPNTLYVTNISTLKTRHLCCCLYHRLRPSHNFLFLNNQTCCLQTLSWQTPVFTVSSALDTKQTWRNVHEKVWSVWSWSADIFEATQTDRQRFLAFIERLCLLSVSQYHIDAWASHLGINTHTHTQF